MSRFERWFWRFSLPAVAVTVWLTLLTEFLGFRQWPLALVPAFLVVVWWLYKSSPTAGWGKRFLAGLCLLLCLFLAGFHASHMKHQVGIGSVAIGDSTGRSTSDFQSAGDPIRASVRESVEGVTSEAKGLVLGITDGDTSLIQPSLKNQFKSLSLTHLTAVSGTNCAILIGTCLTILSAIGLRRFSRTVFCLVVLFAYLVLVGDQPSVLRSAVMSLVMLASAVAGRRRSPLAMVSLAVLGLLLVRPEYAVNVGFALSVFATCGVLWMSPVLSIRLERFMPTWLAQALAVAVSAQLACLPILVNLQAATNVGAVLANLLAEPAVGPATILGLAAVPFAALPLPFRVGVMVAQGIFWLASLPCAYIVGLANFLDENLPVLDGPTGLLGCLWAVSLMIVIVVLLVARSLKWRRTGWIGLALIGAATLSFQIPHLPSGKFAPAGWFMVACDVGQGDATVIRSGSAVAVVDVGRENGPINRCLTKLGVTRISLLVLTHFDLDHVGGVAGAIKGRQVDLALLTQYSDVRPGARVVEHILKASGIRSEKVAEGYKGTLGGGFSSGGFEWLVLSPKPGGAEATTSNEGSVSMFWRSRQANIFTMADLPAVGQQRLMADVPTWWHEEYRYEPSILKLSHHGSADQDPEFLAWVHPLITTISVGKGNPYGHPTEKALAWLRMYSKVILRTDQLGSLSLQPAGRSGVAWGSSGGG